MNKLFIIHFLLLTTLFSDSKPIVYQVGTINSLLAAVYEGDTSVDELSEFGNFGLGTVDAVNGELIALNNNFYRIDSNGNAHIIKSMNTPFAVVTDFNASTSYKLQEYHSLDSLHKFIKTKFDSKNIIYAISIHGDFSSVSLRSEKKQPKGHKPLIETISKVQNKYKLHNIKGTMVGFWFPEYMKNINVVGFHFHFLNNENTLGGHMLDMKLNSGTLSIMPIYDFRVHLINTKRFKETNLNRDFKAAIKKVEYKK